MEFTVENLNLQYTLPNWNLCTQYILCEFPTKKFPPKNGEFDHSKWDRPNLIFLFILSNTKYTLFLQIFIFSISGLFNCAPNPSQKCPVNGEKKTVTKLPKNQTYLNETFERYPFYWLTLWWLVMSLSFYCVLYFYIS